MTTDNWEAITETRPAQGVAVLTKIDGAGGPRNEQVLVRNENLWFFPDMSMYVYYTPTHFKEQPMTDKPTDAELIAELEVAGVAFMKFRGGLGGTKEVWTTSGSQDAKKIAQGMRAAIAKWGQPAQAAEPVAWWIPKAEQFCIADKSGDRPFAKAWEPLYTAPQPVAREPLSHAQAKALVLKYGNDPLNLVFQVELAHGIKGGQHGDDKP